jgi:hypothetical protein
MFFRVGFGALVLAMVSTPSFAQDQCSIPPAAPNITPVDKILAMPQPDARNTVNALGGDVKLYLKQRGEYLNCLDTAMKNLDKKAASEHDKTKVATLNNQHATLATRYNTISDEGKEVGDSWNKVVTAYCAKDPEICKK